MNERRLDLAKKSGLKKGHLDDREYIGDFDWRQFAELIIQECITAVEETPVGYEDYRSQIQESMRDACASSIKNYFRVET